MHMFVLASGPGMVQVKLVRTPYVRRRKQTSISSIIRSSETSLGFRGDMPGQVIMEHQWIRRMPGPTAAAVRVCPQSWQPFLLSPPAAGGDRHPHPEAPQRQGAVSGDPAPRSRTPGWRSPFISGKLILPWNPPENSISFWSQHRIWKPPVCSPGRRCRRDWLPAQTW